jgi:hypothetical protein
MDTKEATLGLQILVQMREHRLMPFKGFRAMSDRAMSLEILLDRSLHRQALALLP